METTSKQFSYKELYQQASQYLVENGMNPLPQIEITVGFNRGRNVLGSTYYNAEGKPYKIQMSSKYESAPYESLRETFMHEIAHVYCSYYYNTTGHGPLFNRIAKALGAIGGRYQVTSKIESSFASREQSLNKFINQMATPITKRDIHSMRCSMKMMARKYDREANEEMFDTYVAPRYKNIFSAQQISEAKQAIFS